MKKRLRTILLFGLLGAVVNMAVAWGFAYVNIHGEFTERGLSLWPEVWEYTWIVENRQSWGTFRCQSNWVEGYMSSRPDEQIAQELVPTWASYSFPHKIGESQAQRMTTGHGWPWLAMWSGLEIDAAGQLVEVRAGYLQHFESTHPRALFPKQQVFPLGFIWVGFFLNTVVYGTVFWLLVLTVCKVRQSNRSFRGLCTKCGYDLKGAAHTACPECGATVGKEAHA